MRIATATEDRTTSSASGVVTALAAPSQGSAELCNWRVRMNPAASGPVHTIDREQLWTVLEGHLEITVDGVASTVLAGQTAILPAGRVRQVTAGGEPAEILVCMAAGGTAGLPGGDQGIPLPWAQ